VQTGNEEPEQLPIPEPAQSTKKKRLPKKKHESDDEDSTPFSKRSKHSNKRVYEDQDNELSKLVRFCSICKRRFLFGTVGSEATQCHACTVVKGRQSKLQKRARKKAEDVVLEFTGGLNGAILPLRDMCLNVISDYIEDLDQLGWIEPESRLKISKIISRRRQLNNRSVSLFLGPDEDHVQLFDCTCILILTRFG
jgi:DNA repair protein RAD7